LRRSDLSDQRAYRNSFPTRFLSVQGDTHEKALLSDCCGLVLTSSGIDYRVDSTTAPRPVPLTRPEMKQYLEDMKSRAPRIPLPELTEADNEKLGEPAEAMKPNCDITLFPHPMCETEQGRCRANHGRWAPRKWYWVWWSSRQRSRYVVELSIQGPVVLVCLARTTVSTVWDTRNPNSLLQV